MQAIETKYFGPSNVKGSRIKATAQAGSVTVGYDHALNGDVMGISKYEMSAMEYLLRYGKDGKKVERKRKLWGIIWTIANLSIIFAIVYALIRVSR